MNKQQRHSYKKKYNKIKKYINRDFPKYDKEYSFNEANGYYQVEFNTQNQLINFIIFPDCQYQQFKKTIEFNLPRLDKPQIECKICFDKIETSLYCQQCSFEMCVDCFTKIRNSVDIFKCPQCKHIPRLRPRKQIKTSILSFREHYRSLLQLLYE